MYKLMDGYVKFKDLPNNHYYLDEKSNLCYKLEPESQYVAKLITGKLEFLLKEEYSPFIKPIKEI